LYCFRISDAIGQPEFEFHPFCCFVLAFPSCNYTCPFDKWHCLIHGKHLCEFFQFGSSPFFLQLKARINYPDPRGFSRFFSNELEPRNGDDELRGSERNVLLRGSGSFEKKRKNLWDKGSVSRKSR